MIRAVSAFVLLLAACSPAPAAEPTPEPTPAPPAAAAPADLKALEAAHDWQNEAGEKLNADWDAGVKALLGKMSRQDAIGAIKGAGFECIYGEAHEDYPSRRPSARAASPRAPARWTGRSSRRQTRGWSMRSTARSHATASERQTTGQSR